MKFLKSNKIFVIIVFVVLFLFASYRISKISEGWRGSNFLKSLRGEIVYVGGTPSGIYKINANGENNHILYSNEALTPSYIRWTKEGKIQILASQSDSAASTGIEYKLVVMDADGTNVQMTPLSSQLSKQPEDEFQKYIDGLFPTADDLYIDKGSVIYLAQNGKPVKVYDHIFYDSKFNRGPDIARWSPDKNFIVYNNGVESLTVTDKKGSVKTSLPATWVRAFDWRY